MMPGETEIDLGPADLELLERHRPLLCFDPQYDYRVLAAESAVGPEGNLLRRQDGEVIARAGGDPPLDLSTLAGYPDGLKAREGDCLSFGPDYPGDARRMEWEEPHRGRIYGRVVREPGRTWLQYWYWLYYNPKNLFGFGKHEGDWEMIQIGLDENDEPELATYAQHDSGEARHWRRAGQIDFAPDDPRRPLVYVAPLSHASYFKPHTHPYMLGIDHPRGDGPKAELPVAPFGPWVDWQGRWGNTERTIGNRIGRGPRSPSEQGNKWANPGAWHQRMRVRWLRASIGRLIHRLGALSYPSAPEITDARITAGRVAVGWQLQGHGLRRGRHLYITAHERHFVIASRIVEDAGRTGAETLGIPAGRNPTSVMVSSYNGLRQRSDPASAELTEADA